MFKRLFALLILVAILVAGLYYWRSKPGTAVGQKLRDTATTGAVKAAFSLNGRLRPSPIEVGTEEGVVVLRGSVPSEELRALAERVAAAVPDVRQVVNHVHVDGAQAAAAPRERTFGESLDDRALEAKVRLAFSLHRDLKGTDIQVSAYRREVTLSGEVGMEAQRRLAVEVAKETGDVESVRDEIRLRGNEAPPADRRDAVLRALSGNPNLKPYKLEVREDGGRLKLTGSVRTGAEKDLAGLLAREVARSPVDNQLVVKH